MIIPLLKKILENTIPRWVVILMDVYIIINTFILSYLIRFNFNINFDTSKLYIQLPLVVIVALISFMITGSYKGILRHTGIKDLLKVFWASLLIVLLLSGLVVLNHEVNIVEGFTIPLSILVIHFLLNVLFLTATRYLFKEMYALLISKLKVDKKVVIYGAGSAGLLTYSVLKNDKEQNIQIVAFIDDDKSKSGKTVLGIPVYHTSKFNENFVISKVINEVIISIQNLSPNKLNEIADKFSLYPIELKIVPPSRTWIDGVLKSKEIKQLKIEDLLGRNPIKVNNPILQKEFNNKVILVTGAAGSIGSEIARQITNINYKHLVLIDQAESDLYNLQQYFINNKSDNITSIVADVRNKKRMEAIFKEYQPSIIFHAAAYKHVPFMEDNPSEAVGVNVYGTKNIADLSMQFNVEKFVMISTDKAVNPTNIMGATKRIAELYINCLKNKGSLKFITTRFGNVLGSNGSVIPLFQNQIKNGGPLTVTHEEINRYFMTIPEACQLVLEAGAMGKGGEIFVFDMGESVKIFDMAVKMIQLSGLKYPEDIDIIITGLRPGEKIYEELLANGENTIATYHEKIMIATSKSFDTQLVKQKINELCSFSNELNSEKIVLTMKEIVPEFKSNNSVFERFD